MRDAVRLHRKQEMLYSREMHRELAQAAAEIDSDQTEPHNMQEIIDEVNAEQVARNK